MTDQPVTPDREALARAFHEAYERLAPDFGYKTRDASAVPWEQVPENNRQLMMATAETLLPYLTDALDRARQQGRDEGNEEAIEAVSWVRAHYPTDVFPDDGTSADAQAGRFGRTICDTITGILARGAGRKAADAPWDTALDVDPFTGQLDHEHGDACEGCE